MSAVVRHHVDDFDSRAAAFVNIHAETPTAKLIENIHAEVSSLEVSRAFPLTIMNEYRAREAWICSPCSAYGDYAIEELERFGESVAVKPLAWVCGGLNRWLRAAQLDRAVTINNWLLSTNLYPQDSAGQVTALRDAAIARYPQHAVWFRSLNATHNAAWLEALTAAGFELVPSRQVYLIEEPRAALARHHNLGADLKLIDKSRLTRVHSGFSTADFSRMAQLYRQLYLEKYSHLNPNYSAEFLQAWHRAGLLEIEALRDASGELCAIVGMFRVESTLTAPIVGYDTHLPQRVGLYRMLMASVVENAIATRAHINFSAGAAEFKRLRGGVATIEYSAVYSAHLSPSRRRAIKVVRVLAERVGVPFMKKYRL